jgi:lysophospholipase L1-like esterase
MSSSSENAPVRKPRTKLQNLVLNLTLFCGTFLFLIVACELVLRLMGYGRIEIYQPDRTLYWRLKPNQNCFTKVDHKPVHINSLGTRGPEFSPDKPAGTYRILSLGDSRTFGWGLSDEETYSALVEKKLRDSGVKAEVINAGVNAWSFMQMTTFFREFGLKWRPDAVIVGEGNLWTQFRDDASPEFVTKFMRQVRLKNFLRRFALYHYIIEVQLQDFYQKYRLKFVPVDPKQDTLFKDQQKEDPNAVFRDAIMKCVQVALTNKVLPILLYMPKQDCFSSTNLVGGYAGKAEISKKQGIPLVDVTEEMEKRSKEVYLDADPVHFNMLGNQMIAERLFQAITQARAKK